MSNFRNVGNDDILKKWYVCMEEMYLQYMPDEDKENEIECDKYFDKIINSLPKNNRKYVDEQLELVYQEFMRYVTYLNEKYYRAGFCNAAQLIGGSLEK